MTRTFKSFCLCATLQKSKKFAEWANLYSRWDLKALSPIYTDGEPLNVAQATAEGRRRPGYMATRAAGASMVGGVQDTGQPEQHVLHWLRPPCRSMGVLFVGLLESLPVMDTSAYAPATPRRRPAHPSPWWWPAAPRRRCRTAAGR